jgi:hypothetical protein
VRQERGGIKLADGVRCGTDAHRSQPPNPKPERLIRRDVRQYRSRLVPDKLSALSIA